MPEISLCIFQSIKNQCVLIHCFCRINIRLASHPAYRHYSDENHRGWYGVVGRVKDLRVARLDVRASVPALTRPPPPGFGFLGFHRRDLSLGDGNFA
jgi:hypothetical protein